MVLFKKNAVIYFMIFLQLTLFLNQKVFSQTKIKNDGFISTGFKYLHGDTYTKIVNGCKIEYDIHVNDNIKGQLDIRTSSSGKNIILKSADITFFNSKPVRLKIGMIKKKFGIEEMYSIEKLPTIRRSIINQYLAYFGYVVRGEGIEISRKYEGKGSPYSFNTGIFYNESLYIFAVGRFSRHNFFLFDQISINGIIKHNAKIDEPHYGAVSLDAAKTVSGTHIEGELFYGDDPDQTNYRRLAGYNGKIRFIGIRTLFTHKFGTRNNTIKAFEPVIMFCFLAPDTNTTDVHRIQSLLGMNIYFDPKVRFRINGDLVFSNNKITKDEYSLSNSFFSCEVQLRW